MSTNIIIDQILRDADLYYEKIIGRRERSLKEFIIINVILMRRLSLTDSLIVFRWYTAQSTGYGKITIIVVILPNPLL